MTVSIIVLRLDRHVCGVSGLNTSSLEDVLVYLKERPQCSQSPVFLGMATVGEDLYWQLIENYFYTLVK